MQKILILIVSFMSGYMIIAYEGYAMERGWQVGTYFRLSRAGFVPILAFISMIGSPVLAFWLISWKIALLVIIVGFFLALILTNIFKKYSQLISAVLLFISYMLVCLVVL